MARSNQPKSRGVFLTLMLVFAAFGILSSLYYFTNTNAVAVAYGTVPSWYPIYMVVGLGLGVANVVGIWMWKKWAVYTIAASSVIALLMQLIILKPVQPGIGAYAYFSSILGAGLWFWAIYRKWLYFE